MADILQTIFTNELSPKGTLDNLSASVQVMAWRLVEDKRLPDMVMKGMMLYMV